MVRQDEFKYQKKDQKKLETISEFVPSCVKQERKNERPVFTNQFTILNNGGDRFAIFLVKVLEQEKDYLIQKVKEMSREDMNDLKQLAKTEATDFIENIDD